MQDNHPNPQPHPRLVEIIIDRKEYKSPPETTGAALYTLASIPADYNLFRETPGPREDEPIPNDATLIRVHPHEKFYSSPGRITPGGRHD